MTDWLKSVFCNRVQNSNFCDYVFKIGLCSIQAGCKIGMWKPNSRNFVIITVRLVTYQNMWEFNKLHWYEMLLHFPLRLDNTHQDTFRYQLYVSLQYGVKLTAEMSWYQFCFTQIYTQLKIQLSDNIESFTLIF